MNNTMLIQEAIQVVNPKTMGNATMGGVGCALETSTGKIFKGVCIDTISGMGFCAEHTAVSQMITQGEYRVLKIVTVKKDTEGNLAILPPCGRCREFIYQTNNENKDTDVVLGLDTSSKLEDLLPYAGFQQPI